MSDTSAAADAPDAADAARPGAAPDPCELGGISGDQTIERTPLNMPAYLEGVTDPAFGTRIVRVSGDEGMVSGDVSWGHHARHNYTKDGAWNANGSRLILTDNQGGRGRDILLDGRTYEVLSIRGRGPFASRWPPVDPNLRIGLQGNAVVTYDVRTGDTSTIRSFEGYSDFELGPYEGNFSSDAERVVVSALHNGARVAFVYDLKHDRQYPDIDLPERLDWVSISAAGDLVVLATQGVDVLSLSGESTGVNWGDDWIGHMDLGMDPSGADIGVGIAWDGPEGGNVVRGDLKTGELRSLMDAAWAGSHVSLRNVSTRQMAFVTMQTEESRFGGEVVAVSLSGDAYHRLFHHRSTQSSYDRQAHAVPSTDGSRVLFASDWGDASGNVHAFVAELCPPM